MIAIGMMLGEHDAAPSSTPLSGVDLNLLVALDALLRERHVTRAAERLGITQSGASRALSRLRALLGDPLLVRGPRGLEPTPRAEALRAPLARVLGDIGGLLEARGFVPGESREPLRLAIPDHLALALGPQLLAALRAEAPGVDLVLRAFSRRWRDELQEGSLDLAFGVLGGGEGALRRRHVLDDPWVVVMREGHPVLRKRWTAELFASLDHGLMAVSGTGPGQVDEALAAQGLSRRVICRASSPVVVAMLAAETDLVVTTTAILAEQVRRWRSLRLRPLPVDARPLRLPLVWHERVHHDPRHRWARELVARVARSLPAPRLPRGAA
ncbi:MAG: LysR family transcriptional regulator [Myxococcota bacterium]